VERATISVNNVLETIIERRNTVRFNSKPVEDAKLLSVLEAGRWAPSWLNKQPWSFIVVRDVDLKEKLSQVVPTVFNKGVSEAPICIVVVVNPEEDPYHHVEAGAVATQNMALTARSLGLSTGWIGVFDMRNQRNSSEKAVKQVLGLPKKLRVVSLLPMGYANAETRKPERKPLNQIVHSDRYGQP